MFTFITIKLEPIKIEDLKIGDAFGYWNKSGYFEVIGENTCIFHTYNRNIFNTIHVHYERNKRIYKRFILCWGRVPAEEVKNYPSLNTHGFLYIGAMGILH